MFTKLIHQKAYQKVKAAWSDVSTITVSCNFPYIRLFNTIGLLSEFEIFKVNITCIDLLSNLLY